MQNGQDWLTESNMQDTYDGIKFFNRYRFDFKKILLRLIFSTIASIIKILLMETRLNCSYKV